MAAPQHEVSACSNSGYGGKPFVWYFRLFMVQGPWESWMPGKAKLARQMGPMCCPQLIIPSPLCIAVVGGAWMETGMALPSPKWKGDMAVSVLLPWESGASEITV